VDPGEWWRFCQPGPDGIAMALPLSGAWTARGRHEDRPTFILTCTSGALGKCVRFGYKPWKRTPEGVSLWAYHEASRAWSARTTAAMDGVGRRTAHRSIYTIASASKLKTIMMEWNLRRLGVSMVPMRQSYSDSGTVDARSPSDCVRAPNNHSPVFARNHAAR
jgi:type IV secretory pathway TrbD component